MQRYFISAEQVTESVCTVEGQDAHHIMNVIRLKEGDTIICCTDQGQTYLVTLTELGSTKVTGRIVRQVVEEHELPVRVTLAQGLPKGDKFEWVLQKGVELGAHLFVPFTSQRTVVQYDGKKEAKKMERWNKIVKEAAEQSRRSVLPRISAIQSFKGLSEIEADWKFVAYEEEAAEMIVPTRFVQQLRRVEKGQRLLFVVGPEGGFAEQEIDFLTDHGFTRIALGKRILRTETASQYIMSSLSFYFEQMGG
jgi:16S rRNA (uracil1498-N3)-methyltransferase